MNSFIEAVDFFKGNSPEKIAAEYGTPVYVYNEEILCDRMHKVSQVITKYPYTANYSVKANTNIHILKQSEQGYPKKHCINNKKKNYDSDNNLFRIIFNEKVFTND